MFRGIQVLSLLTVTKVDFWSRFLINLASFIHRSVLVVLHNACSAIWIPSDLISTWSDSSHKLVLGSRRPYLSDGSYHQVSFIIRRNYGLILTLARKSVACNHLDINDLFMST